MNTRGKSSKSDLTLKISKRSSGISSSGNSNSTSNAPATKKPKMKSIFQFPAELTEEETLLMSKYQKLKKQKKALLKFKSSARNESEPLPVNSNDTNSNDGRLKNPKLEARDAKEVAKKLVKSGTVTIKKAVNPSSEGFKRPLGLERKLISTERSVGYKPFISATIMEGYGESAGKIFHKNRYDCGGDKSFEKNNCSTATVNNVRNDYQSTVTGTAVASGTSSGKVDKLADNIDGLEKPDERKSSASGEGQTLYVSGCNLTEDFIEKVFGTYGKILKLLVVHDRNHSFVTLDSQQATLRAMSELNENTINDVRLKVSFARRRMMFNNHRWSGLPGREFQKYEDGRRELVKYDDGVFNNYTTVDEVDLPN